MKYLFFDIECVNSIVNKSKICSLGYVLTDNNFNIISQDDILMNPDGPFLVGGLTDFRLKYSEDVFRLSPRFTCFFPRVKELLTGEDTIVFGYSVFNDCQYLNSEIIYWELESIDYVCYDIQYMLSSLSEDKNLVSLDAASTRLEIGVQGTTHDSLSDALLTMKVAKKLCEDNNISLYDYCSKLKECRYEVKDYHISRTLSQTFNSKKNVRFIHNVHPLHKMEQKLKGRKISVALNYEVKHFKEMVKIIQRIVDMGGEFLYAVNDIDTFVSYPLLDEKGKEKYDARYHYVKKLIADGSNINIITFDELLKLIDLTEDSLLDIDDDTLLVYHNGMNKSEKLQEYRIKKIKEKKEEASTNSTLGDRFQSFFIDFKK